MKPYKRPYGGTPGPPVMYEKPGNPDDEGAGYGFKSAGTKEKDVYFYHSDHLGSTSYITDRDGNATQFVSYKPYGEALVDEHATSFETPWKFNGKELDAETGLYYYGARYYEPALAVWYGVDALAEKYPSLGGYVYCAGNPVRLVDVDGKEIKVANRQSFDLILRGLPSSVRNIIILNKNNTIDEHSVMNALGVCPNSGNLKALYTIVSDSRIVYFDATARSYQYINSETKSKETFYFQSPLSENVFQELVSEFKGTEQERVQYIKMLNSAGIFDETTISGNFGATLRPPNAQEQYPGGQISTTNNFNVFVNPIGTTTEEQVKNVGHELYGHLYIFFIGRDPRHSNANVILNSQIIEREKESINNLNQ